MKRLIAFWLVLAFLCVGALSSCTSEDRSVQTVQKERTEESKEAEIEKDTDNPEETEAPEDGATTQKTKDADFRNVTWGMTMNEVKRSETLSVQEEDDAVLAYEETVAGLDAYLLYGFDDDGKLYNAYYSFVEKHSNDNLYISDYNNLVDKLTEKYGEPNYNRDVWLNTLFQDHPEDYGLAVSIGHLMYGAEWETPTTKISLVLSGDNYKCTLIIGYTSKTYQAVTSSSTAGL